MGQRSMGFREYLKCQKKDGAIYGPKKRSQLWAEMCMGFREYLKCQKKNRSMTKIRSQQRARIIWAT
jgi:hypothetical protein